ncbi:MAG: Mov34/MPN/PAD-1 family protein [Candidatus Norongarragalinales archaeon]
MLKIRRNALESALQGARETHPDEFICLLRGDKVKDSKDDWLVTEVIIPPFASYELNASSFSPWFIPANSKELATFHSHPSPSSAYPSRQDLKMFSNSLFNLIACFPYRIQDTNSFDSKGKKISFKIV